MLKISEETKKEIEKARSEIKQGKFKTHEQAKKELGLQMGFSEIKSISDLEKVSKEVIWQHFEKLTAFIFEENGFDTKVNVVKMISKRSRRQYDVIAEKQGKIIIAECKKWAGNRYRLSALKTAIKQHKERCLIYNKNAIPIIVTLIEEEIKIYEDVPIVPISKLNSFINEEI